MQNAFGPYPADINKSEDAQLIAEDVKAIVENLKRIIAMLDKNRIRSSDLFEKVMTAEEACKFISNNMNVGIGGFTAVGCPKKIPKYLAENGDDSLKLTILSGGSSSPEIENLLAKRKIIKKRAPGTLAVYEHMKNGISSGNIFYYDVHYSQMPQMIEYGFVGKIDLAIIEAVAITKEGYIVPSTSVGSAPTFAKIAKKIIVEINTTQTLGLEGFHDIYTCAKPPNRKPIPILKCSDRIGTSYIQVDKSKIAAIVESNVSDKYNKHSEADDISNRIAKNLFDFIGTEIRNGRIPPKLLPLQSGFGNVGNAILKYLDKAGFHKIDFYTELAQPSMIDLIDIDVINTVSCSALPADDKTIRKIFENPNYYKEKIILRPLEISNNPEIIRRLGVIAINTPLEIDIYGNANSTHIMGTEVINTIGGSGDFMRNAYLSIFTTPSTAKNNCISRIVPMVSHVDHTEHDCHVLITEYGIADLRGLSPRERAVEIINKCAHPEYRPQLNEYFKSSLKKGGHTPHRLNDVFNIYKRFAEKGTMLG